MVVLEGLDAMVGLEVLRRLARGEAAGEGAVCRDCSWGGGVVGLVVMLLMCRSRGREVPPKGDEEG